MVSQGLFSHFVWCFDIAIQRTSYMLKRTTRRGPQAWYFRCAVHRYQSGDKYGCIIIQVTCTLLLVPCAKWLSCSCTLWLRGTWYIVHSTRYIYMMYMYILPYLVCTRLDYVVHVVHSRATMYIVLGVYMYYVPYTLYDVPCTYVHVHSTSYYVHRTCVYVRAPPAAAKSEESDLSLSLPSSLPPIFTLSPA